MMMLKATKLVLFCVLTAVMLSACAATYSMECAMSRERHTTFKTLKQKCHENRLKEKQANLDNLLTSREAINRALTAADEEKRQVAVELETARQDYASLNDAVSALFQSLQHHRAENDALRVHLEALKTNVSAINMSEVVTVEEKFRQIDLLTVNLLKLQEMLAG